MVTGPDIASSTGSPAVIGRDLSHPAQGHAVADASGDAAILSVKPDRLNLLSRLGQHARDVVPTMTWEADGAGNMTWLSAAWQQYCGLPPERMRGSGWFATMHPEELADGQACWTRAITTGQGYTRRRRVRRASDGAWPWHLASAEPLQNEHGEIIRWVGSVTDVHDLVEAEMSLRESEATLSAVLEALPVGVVIADPVGRIVRDNPANREIWGIPPETTNWEQYGDWVAFWPETGERVQAHEWAMSRALLRGETVRGELIECQPFDGGEKRFFLNNAAPIRDRDGRIAGGVVAEMDVTARRMVEQKLFESEARLRTATDNARVGLVVVDAEHRYRYANRAYVEILGLPLRDLVGLRVSEVLSPVYDEQIKPKLDQAFAGERVSYELSKPGSAADDSSVYSVTYEPGRQGNNEPIVVVVITDVTERVRSAQILAAREAQLRELLDTVNLGVLMVRDIPGTIRFWSEGCARLYGWSADYAVGRTSHELLRTRFPVPLPEIEAAIEHGGEWVGDLRHVTRDGRELITAARIIMRRLPHDGTPILLEALTDVTAQRQAEAALSELNLHLEERVRQEVAGRQAAQETAKRAQHMQAVGQLAGGVAHEFNNILQAVQSGASMIEARSTEAQLVQRFARVIQTASARGASITSHLLSFAQRARVEPERLELANILDDLGQILARTLGGRVTVRIEHDPGLPAVLADKVQLEAALINLSTNARDAMLNGGRIILRATAEAHTVAQSDRPPPGRYVRIDVSDSGTGMNAEILAQATEPFFTTKGPGAGSGLGLSMAKGFAEQSGGALSISSVWGQGTTVSLWLPVADEPAMSVAPSQRRVSQGSGSRRVLVVDDEEIVREVLVCILEDAGFVTFQAGGGADALALLRAGHIPDAMITDFSMPDLDGVSLIREAHIVCPGLPAALLTGLAPQDAKNAANSLSGRISVLRKPISAHQLVHEAELLLAGAPARLE